MTRLFFTPLAYLTVIALAVAGVRWVDGALERRRLRQQDAMLRARQAARIR